MPTEDPGNGAASAGAYLDLPMLQSGPQTWRSAGRQKTLSVMQLQDAEGPGESSTDEPLHAVEPLLGAEFGESGRGGGVEDISPNHSHLVDYEALIVPAPPSSLPGSPPASP